MARIRTIKPEFWTHEDLSALPEATHMLAAALLNYCDDYGYFNANPKLIQAAVSPLREPSVSIPESLGRLSEVGYLELGTGPDGRQYGRITHFDQHQRVAHPTPSKISSLEIIWNAPENFVKPPETFALEQGTWNREGNGTGNMEHGMRAVGAQASSMVPDHEFRETFWPEYPHKIAKPKALVSFRAARSKANLDTIMAGLRAYIRTKPKDQQWCNPDNWLDSERWADEPASDAKVSLAGPRWFDVRYDYEQKYGKKEALKRYTEDMKAREAKH